MPHGLSKCVGESMGCIILWLVVDRTFDGLDFSIKKYNDFPIDGQANIINIMVKSNEKNVCS